MFGLMRSASFDSCASSRRASQCGGRCERAGRGCRQPGWDRLRDSTPTHRGGTTFSSTPATRPRLQNRWPLFQQTSSVILQAIEPWGWVREPLWRYC